MARLHAAPARRWTVEQLARSVAVSRSVAGAGPIADSVSDRLAHASGRGPARRRTVRGGCGTPGRLRLGGVVQPRVQAVPCRVPGRLATHGGCRSLILTSGRRERSQPSPIGSTARPSRDRNQEGRYASIRQRPGRLPCTRRRGAGRVGETGGAASSARSLRARRGRGSARMGAAALAIDRLLAEMAGPARSPTTY